MLDTRKGKLIETPAKATAGAPLLRTTMGNTTLLVSSVLESRAACLKENMASMRWCTNSCHGSKKWLDFDMYWTHCYSGLHLSWTHFCVSNPERAMVMKRNLVALCSTFIKISFTFAIPWCDTSHYTRWFERGKNTWQRHEKIRFDFTERWEMNQANT